MSDIKTLFDTSLMSGDFSLENGDLAKDSSLQTAVIQSLFTDRRALSDDNLPDGTDDKRGWWGNSFVVGQDQIGSRLWLLRREKNTSETIARAKEYAEESLRWLVTEGIAQKVDVEVEAAGAERLAIGVRIYKPQGNIAEFKFNHLWGE